MNEYSRIGTNSGHGHVWERPDKIKARCGGPNHCETCKKDAELVRPPAGGMMPGVKEYSCEVTIPQFGCLIFAESVCQFSGYQIYAAELLKNRPNSYQATVQLRSYHKDSLLEGIRRLKQVFNPQNYIFGEVTEIRYSSLEEELAALEQSHDHYYMMSDDHREWSAGNRSFKRISEIRRQLGMKDYYEDHPLSL